MTESLRVSLWTATTALVALSAVAAAAAPLAAQPEGRRLALVIGTDYYADLPGLDVAVTDALEVAGVLEEEAAFDVTRILDATSAVFRARYEAFLDSIQPNDAVVVYYAGHGTQSAGRNYILPADFPDDAARLDELAHPVDRLLRDVAARDPSFTLLIMDACRNSPLDGVPDGLAAVEPSEVDGRTRIEFAASAGEVASDGLFREHLVEELARPGQDVDDVFRNVRDRVRQASQGLQTPISVGRLARSFYFIPTRLTGPGEALEVLERVGASGTRGESGQVEALEALVQQDHSLAGTELLEGLYLREGTFNGVHLPEARLTATDFGGASMRDAELGRASLAFATLTGADLFRSRMENAAFAFAAADSARLEGVQGPGSTWFATRGRHADFRGAHLPGAAFAFADLRGASFEAADLTGAIFFGSDLRGASFEGAVLEDTDFTGARLDPATLERARREGACRMPLPWEPESLGYAYVIKLLAIEPIPSDRFDGGFEYSRFSETSHLFNVEQVDLPDCPTRVLQRSTWMPIWQSGTEERLLSEIRFRLSHGFLQQSGRRAEIPRRIQEHLAWIYPYPEGPFTGQVAGDALPADRQDLAGSWTLDVRSDGTLVLEHAGTGPVVLRHERRPPESLMISGGDVFDCPAHPNEYAFRWFAEGGLRLRASYDRDPCEARKAVLEGVMWR